MASDQSLCLGSSSNTQRRPDTSVHTLPTELWILVLSNHHYIDVIRSIKPTYRLFYEITATYKLYGLTPALWEHVFQFLGPEDYDDLHFFLPEASYYFQLILKNTRNLSLQASLFRAPPASQPLSSDTKITLLSNFTVWRFPRKHLRRDLEETLYRGAPGLRLVDFPEINKNATCPGLNQLILSVCGFEKTISSSIPGQSITLLEVFTGFREIFLMKRNKGEIIDLMKRIVHIPQSEDCTWCFDAQCDASYLDDDDRKEILIPFRPWDCAIIDLAELWQTEWDWDFDVQINEGGYVQLGLNQFNLHLNCKQTCRDWYGSIFWKEDDDPMLVTL